MAIKYNVQPIVTDGLKVYFDGGNDKSVTSGAGIFDVITGNKGVTGTLKAGASHNASGGYWQFDGFNDYVYVSNVNGSTNFTVNDNYTVSFWVNVNGTQNYTTYGDNDIVEKWSASSSAYPYTFRYVRDTGAINIAVYNGTLNPTAALPISTDTWWYITGVFDHSNSILRAYGNDTATATATLNLTGTIENNSQLQLMRRGNGINFVTGEFAVLQIYNRALSETEVLQNYRALKHRFD